MKPEDQYLKFAFWSEEDGLYVGYCPDLFPWGGACHGASEEDTYSQLCSLVRDEIESLRSAGKPLPPASTRAMREAVPV